MFFFLLFLNKNAPRVGQVGFNAWCFLCSSLAECLQTVAFGSGFMMDVSLVLLPGSRGKLRHPLLHVDLLYCPSLTCSNLILCFKCVLGRPSPAYYIIHVWTVAVFCVWEPGIDLVTYFQFEWGGYFHLLQFPYWPVGEMIAEFIFMCSSVDRWETLMWLCFIFTVENKLFRDL